MDWLSEVWTQASEVLIFSFRFQILCKRWFQSAGSSRVDQGPVLRSELIPGKGPSVRLTGRTLRERELIRIKQSKGEYYPSVGSVYYAVGR